MLVAPGCGGTSEPRLEEWTGSTFRALAFNRYTVDGKRDGATTTATAAFTLDDGGKLTLEFEVVYNPTPSLGECRWRLDGPSTGSGTMVAERLRFLGGQGEGPSFGGRFRLVENGEPRFLAHLPVRPVEPADWSGR